MHTEKKFFVSLKEKAFKKNLKKNDDYDHKENIEIKKEKSENEWLQEYEVIYQSYVLET